MSDKLIAMIDKAYRLNIDEWLKTQPLSKLVELPFEQTISLKPEYKSRAFRFFSRYRSFMDNENHVRDYPTPFYKAKRICCQLALELGRKESSKEDKGKLDGDDWDFAVRDWIRACYQAVYDEKLNSLFLDNELSAEDELKQILLDSDQKIRSEFRNNIEKYRLFFHKLIDWFLGRYDLPMAAKLMWALRKVKKQVHNQGGSERLPAWLSFGFTLLLFTLLWAFGFPGFSLFNDVFYKLGNIAGGLEWAWPPQIFTTILVIFYPIFFLMAFGALIFLLFKTGYLLFLKLFLPRLIASIVVGYLPLVMSGDTWSVLYELKSIHAFLLIGAVLLFSALFLFLDVYNTVGTAGTALGRTLVVFNMGLWQSFAIGLVVSDWMTDAFAIRANFISDTLPYGLFGHIAPQVLLLMFPFALFIGFFVQVIWQDKAVTQPL